MRSGHNGLFYYSAIVFNREDKGLGASFVARFIDLNNKEGALYDVVAHRDPVVPAGIVVTDTGNASQFIDKPWLAVDVPRAGAQTCHIDVEQTVVDAEGNESTENVAQEFPGGRVYQSYSLFVGGENNIRTKVMFTRSLDCGASWSAPIKVSEGFPLNQGTILAIDPGNGTVYLAWRQMASLGNPQAILLVKSTDGGKTFTKGRVIATIDPFEQGTSEISARTTAFPAMAVDGQGRVYVAWSERVEPHRDGRIVMIVSTDGGSTWTPPTPVANHDERGHQFMPSLVFNQGYLSVAYFEQLWDHTRGVLECPPSDGDEGEAPCNNIGDYVEHRYPTGDLPASPEKVFNECLIEVAPNDPACDLTLGWGDLTRRHTLDVFATRALPGVAPGFDPPVRVSRYLFGAAPGWDTIEQLQYNPPHLPLFRLGEAAFIGDYIDLVGAPPFLYDHAAGRWRFNTEPDESAVLHLAWTDNRDVRPPPAGKSWADYAPAEACDDPGGCQSQFDPSQEVPQCDPDISVGGTRNQNVYSARLTDGLVVSALQNTKRLGYATVGSYGLVQLQRAFAAVVENASDEERHFRMRIRPSMDVWSSFLQFALLTELDVSVAPRSSIARTVYAMAEDPAASVTVDVDRIDQVGEDGSILSSLEGGLHGEIVLNPDSLAPDITNPDIPSLLPDITNPDIGVGETYTPDILSNPILSPDITHLLPDITNPDIAAADTENVLVLSPDITNPDLESLLPDITNPTLSSSDLTNYRLLNPDITNGALLDATWRMYNRGNTSAVYDVNLLLNGAIPSGFRLQLLLHKVYTTPEEQNCELRKKPTRSWWRTSRTRSSARTSLICFRTSRTPTSRTRRSPWVPRRRAASPCASGTPTRRTPSPPRASSTTTRSSRWSPPIPWTPTIGPTSTMEEPRCRRRRQWLRCSSSARRSSLEPCAARPTARSSRPSEAREATSGRLPGGCSRPGLSLAPRAPCPGCQTRRASTPSRSP